MNVIKEELANWLVQLTVTIPAEKVTTKKKEVVGEFVQGARLPGFRRGKVPASLIESRFSEAIQHEVSERLVEDSISEALLQTESQPIHSIKIQNEQFSANGDFHYVMSFYAYPNIPLPDYQNHVLQIPKFELKPEHIEHSIHAFLEKVAEYHPVENRPAQLGDFVVLNLTPHPPSDLPEDIRHSRLLTPQSNLWLRIENNKSPISLITQHLIGLSQGQTHSFEVTFPSELVVPSLAEKTIPYTAEVLSIQERILPPFTDETVQKIAPQHTAESLRKEIEQSLQNDLKYFEYLYKIDQIIQFLLPFAPPADQIPAPVLNHTTQFYLDHFLPNLLKEKNLQNIDESQLIASTQAICSRRIAFDCILFRIYRAEKLSLTEHDLFDQFSKFLKKTSLPEKVAVKRFRKQPVMQVARRNAMRSKVIAFLATTMKTELIPPTPEQDPMDPNFNNLKHIQFQTQFLLTHEPFPDV